MSDGSASEATIKVGEYLRSEMSDRGVTISELHERTGTSKTTISYILRGRRYPTLPTLMTISEALGCTMNDLLGITERCDVSMARPDAGGFHEYVCGTMRLQFKYRGDLNYCPICGRRADVCS